MTPMHPPFIQLSIPHLQTLTLTFLHIPSVDNIIEWPHTKNKMLKKWATTAAATIFQFFTRFVLFLWVCNRYSRNYYTTVHFIFFSGPENNYAKIFFIQFRNLSLLLTHFLLIFFKKKNIRLVAIYCWSLFDLFWLTLKRNERKSKNIC